MEAKRFTPELGKEAQAGAEVMRPCCRGFALVSLVGLV